ncbi:MAG: PBSX family phage terminase large subunit, partial [Psychromonas sp.]|nr:PBSX family phage terminase large subunit [Psychromonas sp.]
IRILCARQFQNKIEESVYTLIKKQINRFNLTTQFRILNNKIIGRKWNSEFMFYGLWRHIDEIKSLEDIDILWIEEAHNLTKEQWEILEPTIRKEGSQVWIIFNPKYTNDFVYQNFVVNPPPNTIIRLINYDENEYLSDTLKEIIANMKKNNPEDYEHIYKGVPLDDDDAVIIKRSWIEAAIDVDKKFKLEGTKTTGYDVADSGNDKNATVTMNGSICIYVDEWKGKEDELTKSTQRTLATAKKHKSSIIYDSIGVGAHTGSTLNSLEFYDHNKFNAGGKVVKPKLRYNNIPNAEFFSNLKAQAWWLVADRFRNTYNAVHKGGKFKSDDMIAISGECSNLERLVVELSTPKKDFDKMGRVKVESKDDLIARGVSSPNLADAFIMAANKGLVSSATIQKVKVKGF